MPKPDDFSVGQATHTGLVRNRNEDSFGWFSLPQGELFIVADGMGGYTGGAEASKRTVLSFKEYFESHQGDPEKTLQDALLYADARVQEIGQENPSLSRCGSTIVALFVSGTAGYFIHAGDSRLYVFRKGKLAQLGRDHSAVQEMLQAGIISKKDAEKAPKNVITQSVGGNIDACRCVAEQVAIEPGSTFMLCSDGLWGPVSQKRLEEILSQPVSATEKANQMIDAAVGAGGKDNITVQVIEFGAPDSQTQQTSARKRGRLLAGTACIVLLVLVAAVFGIRSLHSDPEIGSVVPSAGKEKIQPSDSSAATKQDSDAIKPSPAAGSQTEPTSEGKDKGDTGVAKPSPDAGVQTKSASEGKDKGNADVAKPSSNAGDQMKSAAEGKDKGDAGVAKPSPDAGSQTKPATGGKNNSRKTDTDKKQ